MKEYYFLLLINDTDYRLCFSSEKNPNIDCPYFRLTKEDYDYLTKYIMECLL